MDKKTRLGSNPLEWIRDTRKEGPSPSGTKGKGESKHIKQSKQSLPIKAKTGPGIKTVKKGLKVGWSRATLIMRDENIEKVKALAYWERKQVKQVIDEALRAHLKGKTIKPIPTEEGA